MNCVSFLVSFGVNLWALDNDFHTAKDVAAINHREDIIQFLDQVIAKQSALNTKVVKKIKEKAVLDAEKRVKTYQKYQKKAAKKAEKEEKQLEKQRKKIVENSDTKQKDQSLIGHPNQSIMRKDSRLQQNSSLKFSDIVNSNASSGTTNKIKILGGVSRKVQIKKQNCDSISTTSDFKVRDISSDDGTRSVRSLMGIRRDNQILYVPKFDSISNNDNVSDNNLISNRLHMKDVFNSNELENINLNSKQHKEKLYRAISEPDFLNNFEESELKEEKIVTPESSIFVRPGFGSVSFRGRFTSEILFSKHLSDESSGRKGSDRSSTSYADSIGSAGSLAHRNALQLVWDDDEDIDNNVSKTIPILLFLYAHGLKEYLSLFTAEKIDLDALMLLNEEDLISLGLPLGPRRKILKAIDQRKQTFQNPGHVRDSRL
jgi:hypothetical protein